MATQSISQSKVDAINTEEQEDSDEDDLAESEEDDDDESPKSRRKGGRLTMLGSDLFKEKEKDKEENENDLHQAQETGLKALLKREHCRTIIAAVSLLLVGLIFMIVCAVEFGQKQPTKAAAFLIVGVLCSIPGGYQVWSLYHLWKRSSGYHFSQIPSSDDSERL